MYRRTIMSAACFVGAAVLLALATPACDENTDDVSVPGREVVSGAKQAIAEAAPSKFQVVTAPGLGPDRIAGYRHTFARSRSALTGPVQTEVSTHGSGTRTRHEGKEGAFVELSNGYAAFLLKADHELELSSTHPLSHDDVALRAHAKSYFVNAGLPAEQVARVDVGTFMSEEGTVVSEEKTRTVLGHMLILRRVYDGVPIADSFAWARFNKDDIVVSEHVWWPELPSSVRVDINAFRNAISTPSAATAFLAKLPKEVAGADGRIVVHHAFPLGEKWYQRVTWDAVVNGATRSFAVDGVERKLLGWNEQ